jgi:hypothetical protein
VPLPADATWTPPAVPRHYGHIRVALVGYGNQAVRPEAAGLLKNSVDLVIGSKDYVPQIRAVAPTTPVALYINFTQLNAEMQASWAAYAAANGVDPEAAYYHKTAPASPDTRLISIYNQPPDIRPATNPSDPDFRRWVIKLCQDTLAKYPGAGAIFIDNSGREFPATATAIEPIANFATDYGSLLSDLRAAISPAVVMQNVAANGPDPVAAGQPIVFLEFACRPLAHGYQQFLDLARNVARIRTLAKPGPWILFDSMSQQTLPTAKSATGSRSDPRTQLASLAYYYMLADENSFLVPFGGESPPSPWGTDHWWPAIGFDVGTPAGDWKEFAAGVDPSWQAGTPALNYKVYRRDFSKAVVLYKPLSFSTFQNKNPQPFGPLDDSGATTHDLGGSYRPLNADGTLGEAITTIRLRNGEGAILVPVAGQ